MLKKNILYAIMLSMIISHTTYPITTSSTELSFAAKSNEALDKEIRDSLNQVKHYNDVVQFAVSDTKTSFKDLQHAVDTLLHYLNRAATALQVARNRSERSPFENQLKNIQTIDKADIKQIQTTRSNATKKEDFASIPNLVNNIFTKIGYNTGNRVRPMSQLGIIY